MFPLENHFLYYEITNVAISLNTRVSCKAQISKTQAPTIKQSQSTSKKTLFCVPNSTNVPRFLTTKEARSSNLSLI